MKLHDIKVKADIESFNILEYIKTIEKKREQFPNGIDIYCPSFLIPQIETYCDEKLIPFYYVVEDTCSTAKTYSQLYAYEEKR